MELFNAQFLAGELVVVNQIFDQALHLDTVLANDFYNFVLLLRQMTAYLLRQQISAFAQAGQGCFQFVGYMAQKLLFLLL